PSGTPPRSHTPFPTRRSSDLARLAGDEGLLAVIAPASLRGGDGSSGSLFDDTRIAVLTPREAKGMEFDHVIVVEPAQIVDEAAEDRKSTRLNSSHVSISYAVF